VSLRAERASLATGGATFALVLVLWLVGGRSGAFGGVALIAVAAAAYLALNVNPAIYLTVGLGLTVFSGVWQYVGIASLPVKPDRLLILVGLGALLVRAPGARDRGPIRLGPAHALALAAAAYALISALVSGTLTTGSGFYALLDKFGIVPYLMFLLAPVAFARDRDREVLLIGLTVLGGYLGLTSLLEMVHVNALVLPHYISDPSIGIHQGRARGPFLEAVANGLAMFGCGCAAAVGFTRWKGTARFLAALVVLLCSLGVLFTLTRAIWIGSAAGVLALLLGFREPRRWAVPVVATLVVVLGGAFLVIPSLSSKASLRASDRSPTWDRRNTNAAAVRMLEARPLLGWGWSTFVDKSPPYFRQAPDYPMTGVGKGVHNVFLSNAVELGLVGATLWVLALLAGVGGAIFGRGPPELRPWRMMLAAFAVVWFVAAMLGPVPYAMPDLLLWTLAGVALAVPRSGASRAPAVH
jgi:putative inorganic carbon (HCO3(-)) transporter